MANIQIKNILVPVDFSEISENAVDQAASLAKSFNAKLTLFNVMERSLKLFPINYEARSTPDYETELEATIKQKMDDLRERVRQKSGIQAVVEIAKGHIHTEIVTYIKAHGIDLVVMGTHGASGYKEMFIGSNAQRVVTLSEVPVLTLQKKISDLGFKNILVPIDNSVHSREKLNLTMVLADLYKSKIHVIGLPDSDDTDAMNKFRVKLNSVEELIQREGLPYTTSIVHGDSIAKSAIKYARENNCDLIVINTGHESKVTGIFLGAFAQQIVNHAEIPVLSIRHLEDHYEIETPGFGI